MKNKIPQSAKNFYHLVVAFFSALFFRFPAKKLKIVGVTGTDGKTTTVNLIYHVLHELGYKVGMISTVEAKVNGHSYETGFHVTTPSSFTTQKFLRKMVDNKTEYAILEVTSHALDQNRVAFVPMQAAVITNVTPEHLDYHRSYRRYLFTKAKIFNKVNYRIMNSEDPSFEKLKMLGSGQLVTYGGQLADYFGEVVSSYDGITNYAVHYRTKQKQLKTMVAATHLIGEFNLSNILACFTICKILGLEDKKIINALSTFPGVPGRMEEVKVGQDFRVFIDFAHTPHSIEVALSTLKKQTENKLICVFGAAGERDPSKRSLMGQVAAGLADLIILTSEDPRSEDPSRIIDEISKGIVKAGGQHNRTFWKIIDREEAIQKAVGNLASEGDTVAILGKGHEKSMSIAGKEYPWSDKNVAVSVLKKRLNQK
ncbi:MAG TPA: UDP-N-acetylmuramoyl-L-alanyl-D-glutamate--2,6-diaminopimelate ligase [Candidatus Nanoarchaeia archaeon]|nr:UDP-N-acetylmuramoyl-L-alanyl-D-glutamate--2,6-diaminopimelate ligase [uncultured archaeon]